MNPVELRRRLVELVPRLRRYAYGLTGARHDADDLLQATLERVLAKGAPADAELDKWAFRICRNIWVDEIRSRRVRNAVPVEDNLDREQSVDGEAMVMGKLALAEVRDALDGLPDEQRAALSLVVLEGYSYAEAADILSTPIGTIMSRISRARAALAAALRPDPLATGTATAGAGS